MSLPYKLFKAEHPEYDGAHFEVLEALKAGGKKLTGNERVMRKCLRTNLVEEPEVWKERSARAVVNPYGGEIVEQLCASVFGDPLTIGLCNEDGSTDEPSDEWAEFFEDVSRPGTSKRQTFQQHMAAVLDRLLICGVAYTLVDFPRRDGIEVATLAQESELGLRRPFLLEIDPAAVTEWEDDDTGELLWCMVRSATQRRKALTGDRRMVTLTFRVLTREDWQVWAITYDSKMRPEGPQDEDPVTLGAVKEGSFASTVVQQPYEWGYQGMKLMAAWLENKDSVTLPEDKLIIVPTKVINKDNADAFEADLKAKING